MMSTGSTSNVFHNGDGCGDIYYEYGKNNIFQTINSVSNIFFIISGCSIIHKAKSKNIQNSGLCLIITGILSFVYHSSSKSGGFLLDISGMVLWGTSLLLNALNLTKIGSFKCKVLASMVGVCIISFIHYLMELDYAPIYVWNIWSLCFTALMIAAAVIPIHVGYKHKMLNCKYIRRVIIAISMIGFGFFWTQMIHILCDKRTLTVEYLFPFHSLWHLFASIAAYLMMTLLDEVNRVVKRMSYKKSDIVIV